MNKHQILETIRMVDEEKLDIRTVTMGINLLDCADSDDEKARKKAYVKITTRAKNLVKIADSVAEAYGMPIINKRISITPIALVAQASDQPDFLKWAIMLDDAAKTTGVNFIGGLSALVQKGMTPADVKLIESLPVALAKTERVCASVNVGDTRSGINMDAIKLLGQTIRKIAEETKDRDSIGCAKFVAFCNAVEDNPFMAGAFHGTGEADVVINVGVSGPGVVLASLQKCKGASFEVVCETIKKTAFKITRAGELIGKSVAEGLGVKFGILDLSLAPTPEIGDSVARILEEIGVDVVGGHGTTAALALLNDSVKKGGIMASSYVGGLSGAFIPVSEDEGMIASAESGDLTLDKLEAMTCVCSVGLDMIAIPGKTEASTLSAMLADEAAIGMINHKTTAVRIIPVIGKDVGERAYFGGLLGYAPIMPTHTCSSKRLIERGGRIPAPVHSFKN
ncbi:PFL family protein [Fusibacter sp. JL216-2]|uniref:PFL family protein n=1 Tax=Fusibacter sp. JL216-2 TaxID=3071453 RepID=UPI003D350526